MTDRHAGYIVTLADDIREDDAVHTISALKMIKGVISVQPVVADRNMHIAQYRADTQWRQRLTELLRETK